jgi:hypothetical protein
MHLRLMRILKIVCAIAGLFIVLIVAVSLRFWWATLTPKIPKYWPQGSVWVVAPPVPLEWSPDGKFVGCWLDGQRNVDRCQFASYKGKIYYMGDYTSCDDRLPLSGQDLRIRAADYTKGTFDESTVDAVRLQDGTILIPMSVCEARRGTADPSKTQPTK